MVKVRLGCPDHGIFESIPAGAWHKGTGCPACGVESRLEQAATGRSALEEGMIRYVEGLGFGTRHGYLRGDSTWTFDAIVEDARLVFEFNGIYWHSHKFARRGQHYYKRAHAEDLGYRMVTVWEDDWLVRRDQVKAMIRATLGLANEHLDARELTTATVPAAVAKSFHVAYSPQEATPVDGLALGLTRGAELVAAASFDLKGTIRHLTIKADVIIEDAVAALVAAYRERVEVDVVVVYCDRDYSDGSEYAAAGFEKLLGRIPEYHRSGHWGWTSGEDVLVLGAAIEMDADALELTD